MADPPLGSEAKCYTACAWPPVAPETSHGIQLASGLHDEGQEGRW